MRKPHLVIVRPQTTWAVIGLAAMLFIFAAACPARAATTEPATDSSATASQPTTAPASTQPALTASCVPDANSFRAMDRPSDDGTGIIVEWGKPTKQPEGVKYVIQVAHSEKDFQAGTFKTKEVPASKDDQDAYRTEISPAELFCPKNPPTLTQARLKEFAAKNVITSGQLARALAVMEALRKEKPASEPATAPATRPATATASAAQPKLAIAPTTQPKLSPAEQGERRWYGRLATYIRTLLAEDFKAECEKVNSTPCFFRLAVKMGSQTLYVARGGEPVVVEARARANWFKWGKLNNVVLSLIFSIVVVTFIELARRRPGLFIRKIAGLEAIDEAIGRATEMDKPVVFVHGGLSLGDLPVMASVNILARIAYRTAEHDSTLRVTNQDPLVTAVSQEVVQQACTEAGRPDAYNPDNVSLVAYDQFSYVAAVSGIMVRERPGAIFLMGYFGADSLLLAETGSSTGAIQVAGTDAYTQLPFFITTCDYTLMGEELYAASAYLSREPRLLGSLRGQDVGKAFIMFALLIGTIVLTAAVAAGWNMGWLRSLLQAD